jgi:trk system potassium uptake protein TrkH
VFLLNVFARDYPLDRATYLAIFHAVSAFCNAGFSLFPDNFIRYHDNAILNFTIATLLVAGGIGFIVIFDVYRTVRSRVQGKKSALNFHSRIVLRTTFWLILVGVIVFMLFEWFNILQPMSLKAKLLVSLFQSVTPRTCGYNTVDYGQLTDATLVFTIVLMFIGASPASTGGGVKTTTFSLLLALVAAKFRDQEDVNLMERRISTDIMSRAVTITAFSAVLVLVSTLFLLLFEVGQTPHSQTKGKFLEYLFEATSAFGTVGLSTGITPLIKDPGRIILILLMYIGRVGPLTLAIELAGAAKKQAFRYPEEENILIG